MRSTARETLEGHDVAYLASYLCATGRFWVSAGEGGGDLHEKRPVGDGPF